MTSSQHVVLLWTSWQQFLALGMSAVSSPWANLILALLTVLVWLMKHHKQQESESELLFHALAVDDIFRYTSGHHQVAEGKRKVYVDIAANATQPGSARPRRSGPIRIQRVYHLPGTGRGNLAVTETDTESSTNFTSRERCWHACFMSTVRIGRRHLPGYDGHIITAFPPTHEFVPLRDRADRERQESCTFARRNPPPAAATAVDGFRKKRCNPDV